MLFNTESSEKIFHSGRNVGALKFGDSQTTINEKLASEIEALKNSSAPQLVDDSVMNTDKVAVSNGFGYSDSYSVYQEKFLVTTSPKASSIGVEYDLSNLIKNVAVKTVSVTVEGKRAGEDSVLVRSDKTFSSFNLAPDNFPATLSVSLKINDGQSDKVINGKVILSPSGESGMYPAQVKDFQKSDIKTQTQVNDYLNSRLASIEKSISNVVYLGGNEYTVQQALSLIWQEIQDLKSLDLSNIKVSYSPGTPGNVTKTIGEALTDVYTDLNA